MKAGAWHLQPQSQEAIPFTGAWSFWSSALSKQHTLCQTEFGPLYTLCPAVSMITLEVGTIIPPDLPNEETKTEGKPVAEGRRLHGQDSGRVSQALKLRVIISLASDFHSDGPLSTANFQ